MTSANFEGREFHFTERNFVTIQDVAYKATGIKLSEHKRNMVYGRLARRLRKLNLRSFDDYCKIIKDTDSPEFGEFINSITTNLTHFFRENHHFEFLKQTVLPELVLKRRQSRRLRAWSAGCSTGEEPYSIAMTMANSINLANFDAKILATDLDSNVITKAKNRIYTLDRIESLPKSVQEKNFTRCKDGKTIEVRERYAKLITFKVLNLLQPWPMKGPFDFIFCRNVVIYFDKDTQRVLFDRIANMLADDGYLFIGHSENLHKVSKRFKSLGKTIYQKLH